MPNKLITPLVKNKTLITVAIGKQKKDYCDTEELAHIWMIKAAI